MRASRNRNFNLLWLGESVSQVGSMVTVVAMPLVAVQVLNANTLQVGLLNAVLWLPGLIIGLQAGVWVSRWRRRRTMIATSLGRAVLLSSIPLVAFGGLLTMGQMYSVALIIGALNVLYDVAYQSFLPSIVDREFLLAGNAKLQTSYSAARVGGPGVAGFIIQFAGAAFALFIDAFSFAFSALCASMMTMTEPKRASRGQDKALIASVKEGMEFAFAPGAMRTLTIGAAVTNLSLSGYNALNVVFLVRTVGLSTGSVGVLLAIAGVGGIAGAFLAAKLGARLGSARVATFAPAVIAIGGLLVPATTGGIGMAVFAAGATILMFGVSLFNVQVRAFRQAVCPPAILERLVATVRFFLLGTMPLGSLLGGVLGQFLGNRPALWVIMLINVVPAVMVLLSPLRKERDLADVSAS